MPTQFPPLVKWPHVVVNPRAGKSWLVPTVLVIRGLLLAWCVGQLLHNGVPAPHTTTVAIAPCNPGTCPAPPQPKKADRKIYIEGAVSGSGSSINNYDHGDDDLYRAWRNAAEIATKDWRAAGIAVPPYRMVADPAGCSPGAIACAFGDQMIIYVAMKGEDVDRVTIMMHEIGHLLGVPHIDRDPLMNPIYQNTVLDRPSGAAVALARLARKRH